MIITSHTIEELHDPTGILAGQRYECLLNVELPEDDELHNENGVYLRVIFAVDGENWRINQYHFIENNTNKTLDFGLEEDEEALVFEYCKKQISEMD